MFGQPAYLGVATAHWVATLKSSDSLERRLAAHALAEIGRTAREAGARVAERITRWADVRCRWMSQTERSFVGFVRLAYRP
jgi:hypothetical protein